MSDASHADELEPVPPPPELDPRFPVAVVVVSLVVVGAVVALMYWIGWFDKPKDANDSQVLAAVLVLVGTLLTELLVAAGLVLKHSFDLRTYQLALYEQERLRTEHARDLDLRLQEQHRLQAESDRARWIQDTEQERLRKDTVLRAVELLSDDEGADSAPAQQVGALQALATLGEHALAVSLLDQRWSDPASPVLPVAGALAVLDCVFESPGDGQIETSRREAGSVLLFNARKLITDDDVMIPKAVKRGLWLELSDPVARLLILAVAKASALSFPGQFPVPSNNVRYNLSYLYAFATKGADRRNCVMAACAASELARSVPRDDLIVVGHRELRPDEVEAEMRAVIGPDAVPLPVREWVDRLHTWADGIEAAR